MAEWTLKDLAAAIDRLARTEEARREARSEVQRESERLREKGVAGEEILAFFDEAPFQFPDGDCARFTGLDVSELNEVRRAGGSR